MAEVLVSGDVRSYVVNSGERMLLVPQGGTSGAHGTVVVGSTTYTVLDQALVVDSAADGSSFVVTCSNGRLWLSIEGDAERSVPVQAVESAAGALVSFVSGTGSAQAISAGSFAPSQVSSDVSATSSSARVAVGTATKVRLYIAAASSIARVEFGNSAVTASATASTQVATGETVLGVPSGATHLAYIRDTSMGANVTVNVALGA